MELNTVLIAIIAFLLGILISVFLYIRLLKKFVNKAATPEVTEIEHNEKTELAFTAKPKVKLAPESFCTNHADRNGQGLCAICMEAFCEDCLLENEHLLFCREHFVTFTENKWEIIESIRTNPETAEESMFLYEFKGHLWNEESLPTIVTTHYQINTENDQIESQISLLGPKEERDKLHQEIKSFKKPS